MANIVDLQTLCLGHIVPLIPTLLDAPLLHSLPYLLRERLFKYIITNKCLYQFPEVTRVVEFFAHEHMDEFDVAKNGRYINDAVLEKISCCSNLQKLSLRKVCGVSSQCLQRLIRYTPLLLKLHLVAIPYLSDDLMATIGGVCVHLEDLAIVRSDSITDNGLVKFASVCSGKLLKVSLFGCSNLRDAGLVHFFAANPHLLSVNVSRLQTNVAVENLLKQSSTLTELIIAKCRSVQPESLIRLSQPPLCETITSLDFSTLKLNALLLSTILNLPYCTHATDEVILKLGTSLRKLYVARNVQLSGAALAHVVATNPNLEVLNATSCVGIGTQLLDALATECRFTLTTLYLARCNIPKMALKQLVEFCPELTCLDVCGCTVAVHDEFLFTLSLACKKLEILDISDCDGTTLEGITHIAKSLSELESLSMASTFTSDLHVKVLAEGVCRKLDTLNISASQRSLAKLYASTKMTQAFTTRNTPDVLENMRAKYCNKNAITTPVSSLASPTHQCLEALFLSDWPALSIDDLLPVLPYCMNLETLILSRCNRFDDTALEVIANSCKSLMYLDIAQCENISNVGVISIAERCHLLQNLLANSCTKIGDPALETLVGNCPTLVELSLSGTRVSNHSVEHVTRLMNLSTLAIRNTLVTQALVTQIKQLRPNVNILLR